MKIYENSLRSFFFRSVAHAEVILENDDLTQKRLVYLNSVNCMFFYINAAVEPSKKIELFVKFRKSEIFPGFWERLYFPDDVRKSIHSPTFVSIDKSKARLVFSLH